MTDFIFSFRDLDLVVRASDERAVELVGKALSSENVRVCEANQRAAIVVSVSDQRWTLEDVKTGFSFNGDSAGDLLYQFTDRVMFHCADQTKDAHCLHAGAVVKNGKAIVMPANSGDGKSSFVTWLVSKGFDYISDELVTVNDQLLVNGVPRPIQIKSKGKEVVLPLLDNPKLIIAGSHSNSIPIQAIRDDNSLFNNRSQIELAAFVFPKYTEGGGLTWQASRSAESGLRVMSSHVNARNLVDFGFAQMMRVVRATPAFSLEYGGFQCLCDEFLKQVNRLVSNGE